MVPVENAAMAERTVLQWDKDDLDALGLLKVDCLALGMLSAIRRCLDMVSKLGPGSNFRRVATLRRTDGNSTLAPFSMQDIPAEDPEVYAMCQRADTVGVFQIESRAQQAMLPRLKPACFYDLVIEVAIVRPGPIQGGMVHPYLRRRQGLEPVTYPSEAVQSVLARTLGVPIFQEQVMQLAIVAAGFTPGEADHLRRSMAAWRRKGGLEKFEQRLIDGMGARGYAETFARQIYQQILGFGEYGFPESHSASFALLVYVSAWLKRYEPAAFCGALLNSLPMGFYGPSQLVQDARRHGVEVRPADVTVSEWDCTLEWGQTTFSAKRRARRCRCRKTWSVPAPALRLGLRLVAGLAEAGGAKDRRRAPGSAVRECGRSRAPRAARPPRPRLPGRGRRARGARRPSARRGVGRRRHRAAAGIARGQRFRRSGSRLAAADRRTGHRRRLPHPVAHAAAAPAGALARHSCNGGGSPRRPRSARRRRAGSSARPGSSSAGSGPTPRAAWSLSRSKTKPAPPT